MTIQELLQARLSRNQRLRAFGFTLVLFTAFEGYFLAFPRWNAYQDAQSQLAELESQRPAKNLQAGEVAKKMNEVKRLEAEANAKRELYPVAENISTMLIELERLAKERRIEIKSFMPTKQVPVEAPAPTSKTKPAKKIEPTIAIQEQLIELDAEGAFPDFLGLLRDVESFPHPLGINKLAILPFTSGPEEKDASSSLSVGSPSIDLTDRIGMKLTLSAFLLEKDPKIAPVDAAYSHWLPQAQLRAGVANPFKKLIPDPTPAPLVLPNIPILATPDPIEAWHLEGLFMGPGKTAIVSDGQANQTIQPGDHLEGWKVWSIDSRAVTLLKNGKSRVLDFPPPQLPPGSFVGN